ncbi:MAG TPA: hypothetical protein EYN06_00885 [Myxococcales bacterium]|nr:hypothetical protein [Myxococcales bacterium]HIN85004.1 hypothetical protein [Myxococcales bacterium]
MKKQNKWMWVAALVVLTPMAAQATNGKNPIASGARAAGMGGADQAIAADTTAMNTNPAGIAGQGIRFDLSTGFLAPSVSMNDGVNTPNGAMAINDGAMTESGIFPLINGGFVYEVVPNLSLGLGFFTQGGMGAEFKGLKTFVDSNPMTDDRQPIPGTYDTKSEIGMMKIAPSVAYKMKNLGGVMDLSIGVTGNIGLSKMMFSHSGFQFPEPTDNDPYYAAHSVEFESGWATSYGGRVGIMAEFLKGKLSVGATYQSALNSSYTGTTTVDSQMTYDTTVDLAWAQEAGIGLAGRPIEGLTLAVDLRWLNWSATMDEIALKGTASSQVPPGYEQLNQQFKLNWKDQFVVSAGAEYKVASALKIRAGYNWAQSPVDGSGINPLFPAVSVQHFTAGLGVDITDALKADLAFIYSPTNAVKSDADNQMAKDPTTGSNNGYSVENGMSQMSAHVAVGYTF